ncbi:ZAR1-like protein [Oreochromis aureus]|uniref:3CxxC-type domain-containing protein n=1 Tax=Oreochromis aureus TaxID=47969 RepID=A0A668V0R0_OREAU|nr:ZAR1-like protein [Oreochromis aureus]
MEGFLSTFPPYSVYGNAVCAPPAQVGNWGKRDGRFMNPQGLNYLELYKTLLSQVNPSLPPPLKKANTKECGVQVNAKVDKIVQCSLGPKTLSCDELPTPCKPPRSPDASTPEGKAQFHTPPMSNLRFLRPVSIYSPVFDRRLFLKKLEDCAGEGEGEPAAEQATSEADGDQSGEEAPEASKTAFHRSPKGANFQFLEQRYGFFHCKKCNIRWESAYVWCISGTSKVYYKQLCRKCQVGFNPYRVESILCKGCSQTCCNCEKKQRHINMKKPHRQDLCCRCKGMKLSCDATYSFKYIV